MAVRRLACEALTFMCYFEQPRGQAVVVKGLEALNNRIKSKNGGNFSSWLKALEQMLDGQNSNGIKASSNSPNAKDGQLADYAVSF